jgi:hypothetical protein
MPGTVTWPCLVLIRTLGSRKHFCICFTSQESEAWFCGQNWILSNSDRVPEMSKTLPKDEKYKNDCQPGA